MSQRIFTRLFLVDGFCQLLISGSTANSKGTRCSMRETRETALLHGCKFHLHQLVACIFIYSTKWPYVKTMNAKNTKKSPIHENANASITCDFGDGNISRSMS